MLTDSTPTMTQAFYVALPGCGSASARFPGFSTSPTGVVSFMDDDFSPVTL